MSSASFFVSLLEDSVRRKQNKALNGMVGSDLETYEHGSHPLHTIRSNGLRKTKWYATFPVEERRANTQLSQSLHRSPMIISSMSNSHRRSAPPLIPPRSSSNFLRAG